MIEKGYEESSVADIVHRADVGRSTFYAHYADKEDLLKESIEGLMAHLRQAAVTTSARGAAKHPALGFVRPMLEHVQDMRVLFRALANKPSGAAVQRQIHLALTEFVQRDLTEQQVRLQGSPDLVAEFVVGAFLSVCFWWMSRDEQIAVSEIERTFSGLLAPCSISPSGIALDNLGVLS